MILAIDVGNTNIVVGIIKNGHLLHDFRIYTNHKKTSDEYTSLLKLFLFQKNIFEKDIVGGIISSVVPRITGKIKNAIQNISNIKPLIVSSEIKTDLNIIIDNKNELGNDFIAASVGVINKYPLPAIVVDLGTASKIFAIGENNTFLGASIFPGLSISLNALSENTAQLPYIGIKNSPPVIGKNTIDSISSGVIYATAASVDGLINLYLKELGDIKSIIVTGGSAEDLHKHFKNKVILDKNLILNGLYYIYENNKLVSL